MAASDAAIADAVFGWGTLMRFTGLGSTGPIEQIAAAAVIAGRIQVAGGDELHPQPLGDIALRRSDHETARARYEQAQPLYRQVGSLQGEANCIRGLGDIASAEGHRDNAVSSYHAALALYERIAEPFSIGHTHRRLAHLATDEDSRITHLTAAREAWRSIKRDDLVAQLDAELGEEQPSDRTRIIAE